MQAVFADALPRVAVAALNWRGLGGLPLTSPRPYSAACHADVAEVRTLTLTLTPILILTLTLTLSLIRQPVGGGCQRQSEWAV